MPHFILDCSDNIFTTHDRQQVMHVVFNAAEESGLFNIEDIKVRIRAFSDFLTGGTDDRFVHVFGYIMEGRSTPQKMALSRSVVSGLKNAFPDLRKQRTTTEIPYSPEFVFECDP